MSDILLTLTDRKRAAAEAAVAEVRDEMVIGIGTGSTSAFAIAALGRRIDAGLRIRAVATSIATKIAARRVGIPIIPFTNFDRLDLSIDGVDEIDGLMRAIKGAGGAMLREKVIAAASARMIAIADAAKRVEWLGQASVPIEVLPMALGSVTKAIADLGGTPVARRTRTGAPARTDQENFIIDAAFGLLADPRELAAAISEIPGALGHGLFIGEIDALYLGTENGVVTLDRCAATGPNGTDSHWRQPYE